MDLTAATESSYISGYVGLVGRPNSGKSTLLNRIVGQTVAVTHAKPQTTRHRILGILTTDRAQMIFMDTPGLHRPRNTLGQYMMDQVAEVMAECDVLLWLIDATRDPGPEERRLMEHLTELHQRRPLPAAVMGFNKIDALGGQEAQLPVRMDAYRALAAAQLGTSIPQSWLAGACSALTGFGVPELLGQVESLLPTGPMYYPGDQVTDQTLRVLVEELIRKQALQSFKEEVPHGVAVEVTEYAERSPDMTYIAAVIYVERESHKPIVLGHKGQQIRRLGSLIRPEIEELVETRVYLELWVKVRKNWRKRPGMLRLMGYSGN